MNAPEAKKIPDEADYELMKAQREQALACLVLAVSISLAVIFSVFGKAPEIDSARASAELHRGLEKESRLLLESNRASLGDMQKALESIRDNASK